jgi:hypothetical protein
VKAAGQNLKSGNRQRSLKAAGHSLYIGNTAENGRWSIHTVSGRRVASSSAATGGIDIGNLPHGVYFIQHASSDKHPAIYKFSR